MTEKELFMQWVEKEHAHIFNEAERGDVRFRMDIDFMYMAWQASAKREDFVLVPIEPTREMLRELSSNDMNGRMIYKAMLSAVEVQNGLDTEIKAGCRL